MGEINDFIYFFSLNFSIPDIHFAGSLGSRVYWTLNRYYSENGFSEIGGRERNVMLHLPECSRIAVKEAPKDDLKIHFYGWSGIHFQSVLLMKINGLPMDIQEAL